MLEMTLLELDAALTALEALAPFSGPDDQLDCFVEVNCAHDQGLYYKLRPIEKVAEQQGYTITTVNDGDRIVVWEVEGLLAYGRMKQFAGRFTIPLSEILGKVTRDCIHYEVNVYPIPKFQEQFGSREADLKIDVYRAQRSCCANHPGGLRMVHQPSGLKVEVISHKGQGWCETKAKQLLHCKLQAHHPKS